jgi:hypothetical protein
VKADRVMRAMMGMKKLDIEALKKAYQDSFHASARAGATEPAKKRTAEGARSAPAVQLTRSAAQLPSIPSFSEW